MLFVALLFTGIYTVFVPVFTGEKRHLFIGLVILVVLGVLLSLTGEMK